MYSKKESVDSLSPIEEKIKHFDLERKNELSQQIFFF